MFAGTLISERKFSRRFSMKKQLFAPLVTAVLAATINANAVTHKPPHSGTIVVQGPSDAPVLAQANSEAMCLHKSEDGRTVLYVESAEGTNLTALDVSDPGKIRRLAETELVVPSRFDFVESVGNDNALVRYRDGSGEALLSFKHCKHPVLGDASALTGTAAAEKLGETALLSASTNAAVAPIVDNDPTYKVWDDSKASHPNLLATIPGVRQRLSNEDTGTLFFLSENGITVVRRLRVEEDHKIDVIWKSQT
jgi:hypothetical protein